MATSARAAKWRNRITLALAVLILIPSMLGFTEKFIQFIAVFRGETDGAFAIAPMINYLLAGIGFFLAFLWATANGMLSDIEGPKHTMLENERKLDSQT